tara:strand:- start:1519 stop:3897 length:2379 start_codon:yes stop_codon:yes gene_type:complete
MNNSILEANQALAAGRQQAAEKQSIAEQKLSQIKEPLNLIGSEMAFSGINGIGKYLSKKTGIKAFEGLGDAIKKDGFEKGFSNIVNNGKKEIVGKASDRLSSVLNQVEGKKADIESSIKKSIQAYRPQLSYKEARAQAQDEITQRYKGLSAELQSKSKGDFGQQAKGLIQNKVDKLASDAQDVADKAKGDLQTYKGKAQKALDAGKANYDKKVADFQKKAPVRAQADTEKLGRGEISGRIDNLDDDIKTDVLQKIGAHSEQITGNDSSYVPSAEDNENLRSKSQELMNEGEQEQAQRNIDKQKPVVDDDDDDDDDDDMPALQEQDDEGNLIPLADAPPQQTTQTDQDAQSLFDRIRGNLVSNDPVQAPSQFEDLIPKKINQNFDPKVDINDMFHSDGQVKGDYDITDSLQQKFDLAQQKVDYNPLSIPKKVKADTDFFFQRPTQSQFIQQQAKTPVTPDINPADIDQDEPSAAKFGARVAQIKSKLEVSSEPFKIDNPYARQTPAPAPDPAPTPAVLAEPEDDLKPITPTIKQLPQLQQAVVKQADFEPDPDGWKAELASRKNNLESKVNDSLDKGGEDFVGRVTDIFDKANIPKPLSDTVDGPDRISALRGAYTKAEGVVGGVPYNEPIRPTPTPRPVVPETQAFRPPQAAPRPTPQPDPPTPQPRGIAQDPAQPPTPAPRPTPQPDVDPATPNIAPAPKATPTADPELPPVDPLPAKPVVSDVADDVAGDLAKATEVSEVADENPLGDILTAGLGIASLVASAFDKPESAPVLPTLQSSYQMGTSSAVPT